MKPMRVLMVCLGNICRSPLAEGILRQKIEEKGISGITIDSCGTSNYHIGQSPDQRTQQNALTHGTDLSKLRGRQFTVEDFASFDKIFAMDSSNKEN
ncbi:MAG: low molecular weight phosphotyrosine protein phosphatase, partial [Flavobacteriales bacterium]|nr:low molecular weight phosphotyrosine protein phosphatase [Flavobacteriales bacterium]